MYILRENIIVARYPLMAYRWWFCPQQRHDMNSKLANHLITIFGWCCNYDPFPSAFFSAIKKFLVGQIAFLRTASHGPEGESLHQTRYLLL